MFKKTGSLDPHGAQVLKKIIITGSVVTTIGDSVQASSGLMALGTAGSLVLGHVNSIVDKNGLPILDNGAGADFTNTYTAASTNATVAMVAAMVDVSKFSQYSADPDATIGTTTGSNLLGYHTDIVDEDNTDESSAVTTTAQYTIWGVDPADSGNQIVSVYESQVFGV